MKSANTAFILLGLLLLPFAAIATPEYVDGAPISSKVDYAVSDVRRGTIQVPIITWGGDIATIFANGNSKTTTKESIFGSMGLNIKLVREDKFTNQIKDYLAGKSPFLRCTVGMCSQALEILSRDPRTKPVFVYQLTWSAGGDALVVKDSIKTARDLKGKTIAVQAYGPHVDYLTKVLADAGIKANEVKIKWLPDLSGTDNAPMAAFYEKDVDAAMVIIPDALALTSNGTVGSGAEDSVKGARILLSTKTANRIIADVYAVRSDFYKSNAEDVKKFVSGLHLATTKVKKIFKEQKSQLKTETLTTSAEILLDSAKAISDTEGLYLDCEFAGLKGNSDFLENSNYPRNINKLSKEAQTAFSQIGLIKSMMDVKTADWKAESIVDTSKVTKTAKTERFDSSQVAAVVTRKQQQGTLSNDEIFSFEVFFKPNQTEFPEDLYSDSFKKVIELASTYGGALITVEGHSDPMGYLRKQKAGASQVVLSRIKQSAKNLSLSRSVKVRDALVAYSTKMGFTLDPSQFAVIGHGINQPRTGICGDSPCAPKTEKDWRSNMRVVFRIIQVEAESSVFKPL